MLMKPTHFCRTGLTRVSVTSVTIQTSLFVKDGFNGMTDRLADKNFCEAGRYNPVQRPQNQLHKNNQHLWCMVHLPATVKTLVPSTTKGTQDLVNFLILFLGAHDGQWCIYQLLLYDIDASMFS